MGFLTESPTKFWISFAIGFGCGMLALQIVPTGLIVPNPAIQDYVSRARNNSVALVGGTVVVLAVLRQAISDPTWILPMWLGFGVGVGASFGLDHALTSGWFRF